MLEVQSVKDSITSSTPNLVTVTDCSYSTAVGNSASFNINSEPVQKASTNRIPNLYLIKSLA